MTGHIFNIQKFCIHDGPGIRTTVFFKGCNLRCRWCANPESQCAARQVTLDRAKCLRCGGCIDVCAQGARAMRGGFPEIDRARCTACGACVSACPAQAAAIEGREVCVDEVLREIEKDAPFYAHSGGGATFSGGEPLLQLEFATALARALRAKGIPVAVETAANIDPAAFRAFLDEIDFAFVDLKHHDPAAHRAGTGVDNGQILENIRALAQSGRDFMVRIPIIPGFNNTLGDAESFAALLARLGVNRVQLLPFHQMGERKYALLGREYAYGGQPQSHREDLLPLLNAFERLGIRAEV